MMLQRLSVRQRTSRPRRPYVAAIGVFLLAQYFGAAEASAACNSVSKPSAPNVGNPTISNQAFDASNPFLVNFRGNDGCGGVDNGNDGGTPGLPGQPGGAGTLTIGPSVTVSSPVNSFVPFPGAGAPIDAFGGTGGGGYSSFTASGTFQSEAGAGGDGGAGGGVGGSIEIMIEDDTHKMSTGLFVGATGGNGGDGGEQGPGGIYAKLGANGGDGGRGGSINLSFDPRINSSGAGAAFQADGGIGGAAATRTPTTCSTTPPAAPPATAAQAARSL